MALSGWKKIENEAGYPCYVDEATGKQYFNHPQFQSVMDNLKEYGDIKYSVYRIAFKVFALQKQLKVPPLRITSGVFSRHRLSLSESSLSLDAGELEAVLADVYFASEKEGLFTGDVDVAVDLVINLLLNVFDADRKEPIRVLAAKTLLIVLSEESCSDKWQALADCVADHNGCVSPKRLATLLLYITSLSGYLQERDGDNVQSDVDACFTQSAGMLGVSARRVAQWAVGGSSGVAGVAGVAGAAGGGCACAGWVGAVSRAHAARLRVAGGETCAACSNNIVQMLTFKCSKCHEVYFCEKCYLYDVDVTSVSGHKKTHVVHEIIDGETKPSECLSFMKGVRRFFFCTKTKKKKTANKNFSKKQPQDKMADGHGTLRRRKDGKPAIFTSTVGKASGNGASNPASMLQDIIAQLESQNKALKELSDQFKSRKDPEDGLKIKVDTHWNQISTQINRLKILKENLQLSPQNQQTEAVNVKPDRIQAFDLFSPITLGEEQKVSKVPELKTQPRVLSLDSGNFSVVSRQTENLMTSADGLRPVVVHASDTISTVSMNDISSWCNETEAADKRAHKPAQDFTQSLCISEQKFEADLRSVASSNDKMKELNADLDTVLDRLHQILTNNFAMDDSCFDNTQLRETANEMEGLLGTLIRGVEQRVTLNATKSMV